MPRPSPISTEQQLELVALYQSGESRNSLAVRFGASRPFVTDCLRRHGILVRGLKEACPGLPLRHDAFANPAADQEAAYWAGFLMTDGCISLNGGRGSPHVILVLSSGDESHVQAFRSFLGSQHAIQRTPATTGRKVNSGELSRLDVVSDRLASDLGRCGLVPRKTKVAKVIGLEDNQHFWRGAVDGDGYLAMMPRNKGRYLRAVLAFVSGSEVFANQFADFARSRTPCKARVYFSKGVWNVMLHSCHAVEVVRALYGDCSVALPRKLEIAQRMLTHRWANTGPRCANKA